VILAPAVSPIDVVLLCAAVLIAWCAYAIRDYDLR